MQTEVLSHTRLMVQASALARIFLNNRAVAGLVDSHQAAGLDVAKDGDLEATDRLDWIM